MPDDAAGGRVPVVLAVTGIQPVHAVAAPCFPQPPAPDRRPVGYQPPSSEKTCSATDDRTSESVTAGLSKCCEKKSAAATGSVWLFSSATWDAPISCEL
jgi:hypothetical protein